MPIPPNALFADAIDLGTARPVTVVQPDLSFNFLTYAVWYTVLAQPSDTVLGIWAFGDLVSYLPKLQVYGPDAQILYLAGFQGINVPVQVPVVAGSRYWFLISSSTGYVPVATLTLNLQAAPTSAAPIGSFVIPDDRDGYPAAILSRTDGSVLQFRYPFPGGEAGDVLPDGTMLLEDTAAGNFKLYSGAYELLGTVTAPWSSGDPSIRTNTVDKFYVGCSGAANGLVKRVSAAGVVEQTWTLPNAPIVGIAPSNDQTKLYVTGQNGTTSPIIKVWDLVNSVMLADLTAGVASHVAPEDLIVLADHSIITVYDKFTATKNCTLKRYNAAGAELNSTDYGSGIGSVRNRLARDRDDPGQFWFWMHLSTGGLSRFRRIRASDFAVLETIDAVAFEQGINQAAATATPVRFGHSISCGFFFAPTVPIHITSFAPPPVCATWTPHRYTITGTDFPATPVVIATDPEGREFTPEIVSSSSTVIVIELAMVLCGEWVFRVLGPPDSPPFTVPTDTPCECCMSTKKNLINEALLKIGVSQTIVSTQEASREAYTGTILFDKTLQEAYRRYPWDFATKYEEPLTLARGEATWTSALVQSWSATIRYTVGDVVDLAGTFYYCVLEHLNQTPPNTTYWDTAAPLIAITGRAGANGDWLYGYLWPDDCIFARRLLREGSGRTFDASPIPFREGRTWSGDPDNDRLLIFTNEPNARLEYTALVECAEHFADPLFEDYLTWLLAAKLAPSLSRVDKLAEKCHAMSERLLNIAATVDAREHQPEPHGEAAWINSR